MKALDTIMGKIAYAIEFMAYFTIAIGIIIFISSLSNSKYQRYKEYVLLKVIGAKMKQVYAIIILEYFILSIIAVNAGLILAALGTYLLAELVFKSAFFMDYSLILWTNISVISLTIIIGLLNNMSLNKESPMDLIRQEGN